MHLQRAWDRAGEDKFAVQMLEQLESTGKAQMQDRETYWIRSMQSYRRESGYNLNQSVARAGCYSDESRDRMKDSSRKRWERHYAEHGRPNKQYVRKLEHEKKKSGHPEGVPLSKEHAQKIGDALRGRQRSPETIEKVRLALKGQKRSPEFGQHISNVLTGRKLDSAHRLKVIRNLSNRGTPKQYVVIAPTGVSETIENLAEFCRLRGLSESGMYNVACGLCRQYKGWKCHKAEED